MIESIQPAPPITPRSPVSIAGHTGTARTDRTAPGGLAACLIGLGALGILAAAVQLAGPGPTHVLPWAAMILLAIAAALLAVPRVGAPGRQVARTLSLIVLVSAATAVAEHLGAGADAGPFTRSWYGDGVATLVPGLLGQSALLLIAASFRAGPGLDRLRRRVVGR